MAPSSPDLVLTSGLTLPQGKYEFELMCWEEARRPLPNGLIELDMRVEFGDQTFSFLLQVSEKFHLQQVAAKLRTFEAINRSEGFKFELVQLDHRRPKRSNIISLAPAEASPSD